MHKKVFITLFFHLIWCQDNPNPLRFMKKPLFGDQVSIELFALWDKKNSQIENPVVFVGSSSIRKWYTADYFPDVPIVNRGFGGSHISDVIFFINEIWVTNKLLEEKVKQKISSNKIEIKLLNLTYKQNFPKKKFYKIAYLGTSSHAKEFRWLKTLFEKIQQNRKDCLFEIYVNKKWRSYFRSIPRIKMMYPMDWETFYL